MPSAPSARGSSAQCGLFAALLDSSIVFLAALPDQISRPALLDPLTAALFDLPINAAVTLRCRAAASIGYLRFTQSSMCAQPCDLGALLRMRDEAGPLLKGRGILPVQVRMPFTPRLPYTGDRTRRTKPGKLHEPGCAVKTRIDGHRSWEGHGWEDPGLLQPHPTLSHRGGFPMVTHLFGPARNVPRSPTSTNLKTSNLFGFFFQGGVMNCFVCILYQNGTN